MNQPREDAHHEQERHGAAGTGRFLAYLSWLAAGPSFCRILLRVLGLLDSRTGPGRYCLCRQSGLGLADPRQSDAAPVQSPWQLVTPFPLAVLPVTGVDRLKFQLGGLMQEEDHLVVIQQPLHGDGWESSVCSRFRGKTILPMPRSHREIHRIKRILRIIWSRLRQVSALVYARPAPRSLPMAPPADRRGW